MKEKAIGIPVNNMTTRLPKAIIRTIHHSNAITSKTDLDLLLFWGFPGFPVSPCPPQGLDGKQQNACRDNHDDNEFRKM